MAAGTDYDAPRAGVDTDTTTYVEELGTRRTDAASGTIDVDVDDTEPMRTLGDPYADAFLGDELSMPVVLEQDNEFTCSRCYLIVHRSRYARTLRSKPICRDCS